MFAGWNSLSPDKNQLAKPLAQVFEDSLEKGFYKTIKWPYEMMEYCQLKDISLDLREDLILIDTTAGFRIECTYDQYLMTRTGWKSAKDIQWECRRHIKNRTHLIAVHNNELIYPKVVSAKKTGYSDVYEFSMYTTNNPFVNNIMVKI